MISESELKSAICELIGRAGDTTTRTAPRLKAKIQGMLVALTGNPVDIDTDNIRNWLDAAGIPYEMDDWDPVVPESWLQEHGFLEDEGNWHHPVWSKL